MDSAERYEQCADKFLELRDASLVGHQVIRDWAKSLPKAATVLEIACGGGYPVSRELVNAGLSLYAIDSSASLLKAFSKRFPQVCVKCEKVQQSDLFGRRFDAVVCIGLMFLLSAEEQKALILKVANVVKTNGQFLFTAPKETGYWRDYVTNTRSCSLGYEQYVALLNTSGFEVLETFADEGKNNYYLARRTND
ncbi:Class I SAM-dependent methyltransferase [uncultured Thiomicrorhabdus sp.]